MPTAKIDELAECFRRAHQVAVGMLGEEAPGSPGYDLALSALHAVGGYACAIKHVSMMVGLQHGDADDEEDDDDETT